MYCAFCQTYRTINFGQNIGIPSHDPVPLNNSERICWARQGLPFSSSCHTTRKSFLQPIQFQDPASTQPGMKLLFGSHVPSLFTLFILLILHTSSGIHILIITKLLSLFKSLKELCNRTVTGDPNLKVHKIENFFDFDFGICVISLLVRSKY